MVIGGLFFFVVVSVIAYYFIYGLLNKRFVANGASTIFQVVCSVMALCCIRSMVAQKVGQDVGSEIP